MNINWKTIDVKPKGENFDEALFILCVMQDGNDSGEVVVTGNYVEGVFWPHGGVRGLVTHWDYFEDSNYPDKKD